VTTARPRLLFLHTGGTLGMTSHGPGPLAPGHYAKTVLPYVRGLEELAEIDGRVVCNLDSSDMAPDRWEALAHEIASGMDDYDGFVILHGTDTMAWTASALSFMLRGLDRPVVVTGSQRPITEMRTDARANLVHSTLCATLPIPEVGLYFHNHLYRGNRTTKVSIQSYDAFDSPNHAPLVTIGVDVQRGHTLQAPAEPFRLVTGFAREVTVLTLVPGTPPFAVDAAVNAGARALVLRAFGDGNVPLEGWPEAIRAATDAGVAVVVTSQCRQGRLSPGRYANSARARDAGALFTGDMTGETTVVKLMWLLAQGADLRKELLRPMAGECAGANGLRRRRTDDPAD
jgi:L-asparaginase